MELDQSIIGTTLHSLTVIGPAFRVRINGQATWLAVVQCDCGTVKVIRKSAIGAGDTVSCGCHRRKRIATVNRTRSGEAAPNYLHGKSGSRLNRIWNSMLARCRCKSASGWDRYGGRGIAVCIEWQEFTPFHQWAMANGYSDSLEIDRINNDGNYEPSNCRWATRLEQANNRRNSRRFELYGRVQALPDWCREYGHKLSYVRSRLSRGWSIEEALTIPYRQNHRPKRPKRPSAA